MKREWLPYAILRIASLLAPGDQRAEWLDDWRNELWYIPRRGATLFCLGAFRDALWLRRNNQRPVIHLESPMHCLAFLAALAAVSLLFATRLPGPQHGPWPKHFRGRDLLGGCLVMLLFSSLLLPAMRFVMGRAPGNRQPTPWPNRLRRGIFLALKIALVQPSMLCGFGLLLWIGPMVPMVPNLAMFASWMLILRWVLIDQRSRCPVCLRLLTDPVRIGTSSQTFLEWYGSESWCLQGHGLLHVSEISASYSENPQWLCLDDSWQELFSEPAGRR